MQAFFVWVAMGGYAKYVWSAYGLVFAVLLLHPIGFKRKKIRIYQQLRLWYKKHDE